MVTHKKVGIGVTVAALVFGAVVMAIPRQADAACEDTHPAVYCGQKFLEAIPGSVGYNRGPNFGSSDYDKATGFRDAYEKCKNCAWKHIERPEKYASPRYTPSRGGASR